MPLQELPDEIFMTVLTLLDVPELLRLSRTSKAFQGTICENRHRFRRLRRLLVLQHLSREDFGRMSITTAHTQRDFRDQMTLIQFKAVDGVKEWITDKKTAFIGPHRRIEYDVETSMNAEECLDWALKTALPNFDFDTMHFCRSAAAETFEQHLDQLPPLKSLTILHRHRPFEKKFFFLQFFQDLEKFVFESRRGFAEMDDEVLGRMKNLKELRFYGAQSAITFEGLNEFLEEWRKGRVAMKKLFVQLPRNLSANQATILAAIHDCENECVSLQVGDHCVRRRDSRDFIRIEQFDILQSDETHRILRMSELRAESLEELRALDEGLDA